MPDHSEENDEHRSLTRATVHGVFWMTMTRGLKAPLSVVAVAILARILTPADFGIIALGMVVASFSDMLIDGSFSLVLIQRKTIDSKIIGATFLLTAALATLFAVAVVALAPFIGDQFDFANLREVLVLFAAILPVTAITTVTTALLQRALEFRVLTINSFISQIVYSVSAVALAVAGYGLWSLVWSQMLQSATDAILGFLAVRRRYRLGISTAGIREVLHSGGMFTASKTLKWAANSVDRVIVGHFLGATELGFYTRATILMRTARQMTGAGPTRVLFSSFAKMQHDPARMRKGYERSLSISLIASSLVSFFLLVNAELIVRILLGPKWLAAVPVMQIIFLGFFPKSGAVVAESVPLAFGLAGASALREAAQLLLVIVGVAIGAQFGIVGAAVGVCLAYWLFYGVCLILVQQLLQPDIGETVKIHLTSIALAIPPLVASIATRWLIPGDTIFIEMIPAAVFGAVSALILLVSPATLVTTDVTRARAHLWSKVQPHVPRFGHGG